jgi:hypothetical protein
MWRRSLTDAVLHLKRKDVQRCAPARVCTEARLDVVWQQLRADGWAAIAIAIAMRT